MKVLLDECVPRRLALHLIGHEVKTAPEMGWASIKNGALLRLAEGQFDVFITVDRNLSFQQNIVAFSIGVLVLHAPSNRLNDLIPRVGDILAKLPVCTRGTVTHVGP